MTTAKYQARRRVSQEATTGTNLVRHSATGSATLVAEQSNGVATVDADQLGELSLSLTGATVNVQWENDRVYKVGGKIFACTGLEATSLYSFKVDDERFLELTDLPGIKPAPYLARAKWIQIDPAACPLDDGEIEALVRRSHELVFGKLPKKTQKALSADSG